MPTYDLHSCLDRVDEVGLFPASVVRILELTRSRNATVDDLEKAVSLDSVLAGRVLKVANSPLYGLPVRIGTLKHAVQMLGFSGTRDIALSLAVSGITQHQTPWGAQLWRHAEVTAWTCRILGRNTRRADADGMFVAGLLHDLGQQLMLSLEYRQTTELFEQFGTHDPLIIKAEVLHQGFHHGQLGAECLRRWKLPSQVAELVERHHEPLNDADGGYADPRSRAILKVADDVADAFLDGSTAPQILDIIAGHEGRDTLRMSRGALVGAVETLFDNREDLLTM